MPTELTDAELDRILEYCEKATLEPWDWSAYGGRPNDQVIALVSEATDILLCTGNESEAWGEISVADQVLIARARTDLPRVVAELKEARRELTQQTADARTLGQLLTDKRAAHADESCALGCHCPCVFERCSICDHLPATKPEEDK